MSSKGKAFHTWWRRR